MAGALIGALRVSLSAETSAFETGMKRAQRQAATTSSAISRSMGALKAGIAGFATALSIGLLTNAIKAGLDYAGSLGEVSQQLGVTTKDLQVFRYAAGQNGVAQEELDKALGKLTVTLGQVAAGAKAPTKALQAIGISAKELAGKDTGEAFRIIADGLAKVEDRSQRAAVEVALFGRAGAKLDTLLAGGSAGINELAAAAEKLGIVLSDEQIQKADETADKLDALKTVLQARVAGIVADNADSILSLANALSNLVNWLGTAIRSYKAFFAMLDKADAHLNAVNPLNSAATQREGRIGEAVADAKLRDLARQQAGGPSAEERAMKFRKALGMGSTPKPASDIPQFLAGGGGGSKRGGGRDLAAEAERKRIEALRASAQFEEDIRRAQMDIARSSQDLVFDYRDRAQFALQILDLEKQSFEAQLKLDVATGEITQAQADKLKQLNDEVHSLEVQAVERDREHQRFEDRVHLADVALSLEREKLESEEQLAETAADQRAIQLRLLDLAYQQEKLRLQAILADKQATYAAQDEARMRLANLDRTRGNDRQAVINNTRGPWEQWQHDASNTSEAMENLKVQGIEGAIDALGRFTEGWDAMRDVALSALKDIVAQLIRVQLMKAAASIFGAATGTTSVSSLGSFSGSGPTISSLPAFATGGSMVFGGRGGVDKNILSYNGLAIAKVSRNERMSIDPSGHGGSMGSNNFHVTVNGRMTESERRETGLQIASAANRQMARAAQRGIR